MRSKGAISHYEKEPLVKCAEGLGVSMCRVLFSVFLSVLLLWVWGILHRRSPHPMYAPAPQEFSSLNAPILLRLLYEAPIEEIISISGMSGGFTC